LLKFGNCGAARAWGGMGGTDKKLKEFFIHRVLKTTSLSQSALPPK